MYTIYEIIGLKVGATKQKLEKRFKQNIATYKKKGIDISGMECVALEYHTIIEDATRRERELQAEKGYPVDTTDYIFALKRQRMANTKQAREKSVATRDKMGFKPTVDHLLERNLRNRQRVRVYSPDGTSIVYNSISDTVSNTPYSMARILHLLKNGGSTRKNYKFEYA